jgi:hypothetical protein
MDLTVNPSYSQSSTFTICDNDSIFWEGNYYNTSGTFYENYVSSHGCDSILELDLTVNPAYYQLSIDTICENDSLFWEGSYCYSDSLYTLIYPLSSGCDSILELDLTVVPNPANITITGANTVSLHQSEIYAVLPNTYYYNWAVEKGTIIQQYSVNMAKIQWDSIGLGHIFIIAENQLGCLSDTIVYDVLIGTTNVENISDNDGLIIYPNPTSGEIIIETDGFIEVEIYNRIGQIILKSDKKNLNLQEFSSGVYFVKVLTDKGVKTAIVVKEQ